MRIAIALSAGLLALAAVMVASGHASPERFDPSPGQVLDTPPVRVEGWFTQDIRRQGDQSSLRVYRVLPDGSLGERVDSDATVIDDEDRRHMYVDLTADAGAGEYAVAWQTLSDEDDELDGDCYRFFVGQEAADAAHEERSRIDVAGVCPTAAVSSPPEPSARIELDVPEESANGEVTVGLSTEGATVRLPTNEGRDPAFGHYHLYLDTPPNLIHSHDGEGTNPNDVMTVADSHTFTDLKPGWHVITAVLFYDDHSPFNPPVVAGASVRVLGDGGDGGGISTAAAVGIAIGVGVAALVAGSGLGLALRRR